MSRSYRRMHAKAGFVYDRDELIRFYNISVNTPTNWMKAGLRPVDDKRPMRFTGTELNRFHDARRAKPGQKLSLGQLHCYRCKIRVYPDPETVRIESTPNGVGWITGNCPDCEGTCRKPASATDCDKIRQCLNHNTGLFVCDEGSVGISADIVTSAAKDDGFYDPGNERIIFELIQFLGGRRPRTIQAFITSVRHLESYLRKPFDKLTVTDADRYRRYLVETRSDKTGNRFSRSTLRHRISHNAEFLCWLVKRPQSKHLDQRLPEYIALAKGMTGSALQPKPRPFMSLDEVRRLLKSAPTGNICQRRDKAIVAFTVMFGTRSNTTASMLVSSLSTDKWIVNIDSDVVRAKAAKSYIAGCFPDGWEFISIIEGWCDELVSLGLDPGDALFPPDEALQKLTAGRRKHREAIEPWNTDGGVRQAFRRCCRAAGLAYFNPHSIRHFLQSRRDNHCKTADERKAYSKNFGHETVQISEGHYGKPPEAKLMEIMAALRDPSRIPDGEKDLLLAFHEHELTPGSEDFIRAQALHIKRMTKRSASIRDETY